MPHPALEAFARVVADPAAAIGTARAADMPIVRTLGVDAPRELILAAGALPVRVAQASGAATPGADRIMGDASMGLRGKRVLEQLIGEEHAGLPLLITHADATQPQIFAALRELGRQGEPVPSAVHFLDLLHLNRDSSRRYNLGRLRDLAAWLGEITGKAPTDSDIAAAGELVATQAKLLALISELRWRGRPRLSGSDALTIIAAAAAMPPDQHIAHMQALLDGASELPELDGTRLYLCGTPHENPAVYALIEASGAIVVGEDHDWGETSHAQSAGSLERLADPGLRPVARSIEPAKRAARIAEDALRRGAEMVVHLTLGDDEAAPWDLAAIKAELPPSVAFKALRTSLDGDTDLPARIFAVPQAAPAQPKQAGSQPSKAKPATGARSRKSLQSVASFGAYQREWFAGIRADVAAGAPFAVVNANTPQEILRAMNVPFVVNQWWASIVAAKQQSRRYLGLLKERDYPTNVEAYSSQGLAAAFDTDGEQAPWGGLPAPDFVHAVASSDPTVKIFSEWSAATGADCFIYERTVDPRWSITTRWWEDLPERWDETLEPERIDLMVEELRAVITTIEAKTGRAFSPARFAEVMDLVNEQEEYYRRTRDLIAATIPAPIGIVDSMPATMVPQWHRGTEWARDAARAFYEEVKERVDAGLAAVPVERVRLMWVGRGLWSDMGFYQKWEESHGAVFVWSMYLALAADGYIRSLEGGRDPMRALAARFLTMGDELRMPSWAGPWHVHEARTHAVDGAVALRDADPFVVRALREAGIPVLELSVDNFSRDGEDESQILAAITSFIEGPAAGRAAARLGGDHAAA
jgi:benzoyl-CoA reductase/2-hydroxyglutaryl-CoA dehydratase subunit BcrC/BadD/HgdB